MNAVGIITLIFGVLQAGFSTVSLIGALMQRYFLRFFPLEEIEGIDFDIMAFIDHFHQVMFFFLPLQIIIGILLIIGGVWMIRKARSGIVLVRWGALFTILAYIGYVVAMLSNVPEIPVEEAGFIQPLIRTILLVSALVGSIFACGYPVFLLIYLRNKSFD